MGLSRGVRDARKDSAATVTIFIWFVIGYVVTTLLEWVRAAYTGKATPDE